MKSKGLSVGVCPILCMTCYRKFQNSLIELCKMPGEKTVDVWKKMLKAYSEVGVGSLGNSVGCENITGKDHLLLFVLELFGHDLCTEKGWLQEGNSKKPPSPFLSIEIFRLWQASWLGVPTQSGQLDGLTDKRGFLGPLAQPSPLVKLGTP